MIVYFGRFSCSISFSTSQYDKYVFQICVKSWRFANNFILLLQEREKSNSSLTCNLSSSTKEECEHGYTTGERSQRWDPHSLLESFASSLVYKLSHRCTFHSHGEIDMFKYFSSWHGSNPEICFFNKGYFSHSYE